MSHQEALIRVGKRIAQGRAELRLTQRALAKHLGISWEMVSRYERGVSNPMTHLFEIASFLKKPVSFFVEAQVPIQTPEFSAKVSESFSPQIFDKLFVPLLVSPQEFTVWQKSGAYTGMYQAPLWMHRYDAVWVTSTQYSHITTPQVQGTGMLFLTTEAIAAAQFVMTVEDSRFTLRTSQSVSKNATVIGSLLAWEKRFV